ncbi:MAG: MATE family efflux transporter [Armatimonadetes bacterium]|nr:MATE family efflux transporter [Armatimonadota bacterium]
MESVDTAQAGPEPETEHSARTVWILAWPAVALNTLQTVNALLDTYFVQHLPVANLTAIGGATSILFLLVSMAIALGTASTALVSRAYGAGDREGFVTANQKCLGLALTGGLAFAALSLPGSALASVTLLPADAPQAQHLMRVYLGTFALALPPLFLIQSLAGALRGTGDTKSPMVISGLQIGLHIVCNALLINGRLAFGPIVIPGFGLGIFGAGLAMVVSSWAAAAFYLFWAGRTSLGASWRLSWPGMAWVRRILVIAVPAAMMSVVRVTSLMALTGILKSVPGGANAIAAMRPAFSIESLAFMPPFGLSIAAAALVGQSLGMGRPDRASKLAWTAAHHAAVVSTVASVLLFVFAPNVAHSVVANQPEVADVVARYLRFICVTEVLFAYAMVLVGAMQGAGDTVRPMWLTVVCMWGVRVGLAGLFAIGLKQGADGCWLAMTLTQGVQGPAAMILFKQGAWKTVQV